MPLSRRQHRARGYLPRPGGGPGGTPGGPRDAALVRFLAYTGLRFGEAAGLVIGDVAMLHRRATVQRSAAEAGGKVLTTPGKTSTRRTVPVPAFLVVELSALMVGRSRDDLLFTGPGSRVLRPSNWRRRVFSPALTAARFDDPEFPKVTPHDLRHTAASLAISAGANVKADHAGPRLRRHDPGRVFGPVPG
ncbi:tyrosine-type recombinase/integrase [Dietzia maris]|uniref:tyrosine-type recombinase/integrase n=1 Tax=Dietzia TaxID=37914 RepID=UPI003417542C